MSKLPDFERRGQAFRLFVRYRNISQVGKELGIPVATLHVWKKDEKWDDKLLEIQTRLGNALKVYEKIETNGLIDSQVTELKLLELLETEVYTKLKDGSIKPTSWRDVIATVELVTRRRALITGEPTERSSTTIDIKGMNEKDLDERIAILKAVADRNFSEVDLKTLQIESPATLTSEVEAVKE